jgi:hypothetical protein
MNRRKFISYSTAGALAAGLTSATTARAGAIVPGQQLAAAEESNGGRISWDEFIELAVAAASPLADDRSQEGQDTYLYGVGAIASRLGELPEVTPRDFGGLTPAYELQLIFRDASSPFIVLYWRLAPAAVFPAHCHPDASVCTLCTHGETVIRNYDTAEGSPHCWEETDDEFGVTETRTDLMRPGLINTVSSFRNNIHRFEAGPNGAEGIDITTGYNDGKQKSFSYLALDTPTRGEAGLNTYRGRWVGKDLKRAI